MTTHNRFLQATIAVAGLTLISGCGGSGGDSKAGSTDAFSADAYHELTSSDQSLSGIWMLVKSHNMHRVYSERDIDGVIQTETTDLIVHYRELFVIADNDVTPDGSVQISGCDQIEPINIVDNRFTFGQSDWIYDAQIESNSRITGSYNEHYPANDGSRETTNAAFTLIKIADLPENLPVDASSDAYDHLPITSDLDAIGTVSTNGHDSENYSLNETGPVTCFTQEQVAVTVTTSASQQKGQITRFWAGRTGHLEVEVLRDEREGDDTFQQIEARTSNYQEIEIDNSVEGQPTGTIEWAIKGTNEISIDAAIRDSLEGDAETTIDITLP